MKAHCYKCEKIKLISTYLYYNVVYDLCKKCLEEIKSQGYNEIKILSQYQTLKVKGVV